MSEIASGSNRFWNRTQNKSTMSPEIKCLLPLPLDNQKTGFRFDTTDFSHSFGNFPLIARNLRPRPTGNITDASTIWLVGFANKYRNRTREASNARLRSRDDLEGLFFEDYFRRSGWYPPSILRNNAIAKRSGFSTGHVLTSKPSPERQSMPRQTAPTFRVPQVKLLRKGELVSPGSDTNPSKPAIC